MKTIILAADHAGFELKEKVKAFLVSEKYTVSDVGAHELVPEDDFPAYMLSAAMKVAEDPSSETRAILFGGSGQGEAMIANRLPGVRAVVWYGGRGEGYPDMIKLSREHNDANILSIGARFVSEAEAQKAVALWLKTDFSGAEKYARRNRQIDEIE